MTIHSSTLSNSWKQWRQTLYHVFYVYHFSLLYTVRHSQLSLVIFNQAQTKHVLTQLVSIYPPTTISLAKPRLRDDILCNRVACRLMHHLSHLHYPSPLSTYQTLLFSSQFSTNRSSGTCGIRTRPGILLGQDRSWCAQAIIGQLRSLISLAKSSNGMILRLELRRLCVRPRQPWRHYLDTWVNTPASDTAYIIFALLCRIVPQRDITSSSS